MIRVAICDTDTGVRSKLRNAIEIYVANLGIANVEVAMTGSCADLLAATQRLRSNYFDLVLCNLDGGMGDGARVDGARDDGGARAGGGAGPRAGGVAADGDGGSAGEDGTDGAEAELIAALKRIRDANPLTEMTLYSTSADKAMCAYDIVASFFRAPCDSATFARTVAVHLRNAGERKRCPIAIKTQKGLVNLDLRGVTFVESSKKGPVIHVPGGRTVGARGTLQALFERLNAVNPQLVKAGGSFIVNLDNIRTTGESSVIFGDGEAIIIPVRARKALKEAFAAYRLGVEAS